MPEYQAYALDREGRITEAAKVIACTDDTQAMEHAAKLAREVGSPVEVWEGTRRVGCVAPDSYEPSRLSTKPRSL
jgi:hypothetical protein